MRAKEFLVESELPSRLLDIMRTKGYRQLGGEGADAAAFLEPGTGMVLKIFGTQYGSGTNLTLDQKIFKVFADYCHTHQDNPFLPQFSGWETFYFDGNTYLQIRMERLFEFTNISWGDQLEILVGQARYYKEEVRKQRYINMVMSNSSDYDKYDPDGNRYNRAGAELLSHLGTKGFNLLWDTINELATIAKLGRFQLDLHSGNFMLGSDGHIVINDPFLSR
jgi:hypothetical protein